MFKVSSFVSVGSKVSGFGSALACIDHAMETVDQTGHDYVRFLVEDKRRELHLLESRHRRALIQPDDY